MSSCERLLSTLLENRHALIPDKERTAELQQANRKLQALTLYREHGQTFDLILLDLNMPGMGGHKCLQELLRINPAVRVVIASGYSANGQARETLNSGAADCISKPYQLWELATVVRETLGVK